MMRIFRVLYLLAALALLASVACAAPAATVAAGDVVVKGPEVDVRAFLTAAQIADVTSGAGNIDVSAAVQKAIDYCAAGMGHTLKFPRGRYRIAGTLHITTRGQHWVGEFGQRGDTTNKGSQLYFVGTGSCIEIGSDDGIAWGSSSNYNGPQGAVFENLSIYSGVANRTTALNCGSGNYAAGSYGIRDWRGGDIRLRNVDIEGFEYSFWGIKSDFDSFTGITSLYSKFGLYFGPRSDQGSVYDLYSYACDHAVTMDGASGLILYSPKIVACGSATDFPILQRLGSGALVMESPWFEQNNLNFVLDAFVGAGMEYGWMGTTGTGGFTNTNFTRATIINNPTVSGNNPGDPGSTKYLVKIGAASGVVINEIVAGNGLSRNANLLYYAAFAAGFDNTYTTLRLIGEPYMRSQAYINLGAGSPSVSLYTDPTNANYLTTGTLPHAQLPSLVSADIPDNAANTTGAAGKLQDAAGNSAVVGSDGRFYIRTFGASPGKDELRISHEDRAGAVVMATPNYTGGQTTRVEFWRTFRQAGYSAAPISGTWEKGDIVLTTDPAAGGKIGWVCIVGGTPGTWKGFGAIDN